ncbi:head maturation protease, ClpP-related [Flavobacterium sp. TN-1]
MFASYKTINQKQMLIKTIENTLYAYGSIWQGDGTWFCETLNRLESSYSQITIRLHTDGGSVFEGNLMFNAINKSTSDIEIIIDGIAASMGAIIILASNKVKIVDNGFVMIHAPSVYGSGTASELESQASLLRKMESTFKERLSTKTNLTAGQIDDLMIGDHWFNAQECLDMGLVSEIVPWVVQPAIEIQTEQMQPSDVFSAYASLLTMPNLNSQKLDDNMKQLIIQALKLPNVTAQSSDTAVLEALQSQIQTERDEKNDALNELKQYKKSQITAYLDRVEAKGILKKEDRQLYENIGEKAGFDALAKVLEGVKPTAPNISALITNADAQQGTDQWTFDQWQKEDPKGLEAMASANPDKFQKLFNQKYKK